MKRIDSIGILLKEKNLVPRKVKTISATERKILIIRRMKRIGIILKEKFCLLEK